MQQAQLCVTYSALIVGTLCFLVFLYSTYRSAKTQKVVEASAAVVAANKTLIPVNKSASVSDVSSLVEALTKLTDSLAKAGPSLTSLIGAVLFYTIAAIGSGALTDATTSAAEPTATTPAADAKPAAVPQLPVKAKLPPPK
jgi:hypothetical protein